MADKSDQTTAASPAERLWEWCHQVRGRSYPPPRILPDVQAVLSVLERIYDALPAGSATPVENTILAALSEVGVGDKAPDLLADNAADALDTADNLKEVAASLRVASLRVKGMMGAAAICERGAKLIRELIVGRRHAG